MSNKRSVHRVSLKIFKDYNTGEWGVAHKETFDDSNSPFNASWSGLMLFHDIMEHWHEFKHKYFRGQYALNVAGEMAAMGAMWYYYEELGLSDRLDSRSIYPPGDNMRMTTENLVQEAIYSGYCEFGNTLECCIPYQRPTANSELEYQIEKMWENIPTFKWGGCEEDKQFSIDYKKSVTFAKIANAHRWGFYQAQRLIPVNNKGINFVYELWQFFEDLTKNNIEEIYNNGVTGFEFAIYKYKGELSFNMWAIMGWKNRIKITYPKYLLEDIYNYNIKQEQY